MKQGAVSGYFQSFLKYWQIRHTCLFWTRKQSFPSFTHRPK